MNKKQAVIILTLLVLIICAGVLAAKMNDPLYVDGMNSSQSTPSIASGTQKTNADYFAETRLTKTADRNNAIQTLKTIADDKNVSQDSRNNAANKAAQYAEDAVVESKIEADLKAKGFTEALCWIDDDPKVRIIVKSQDKLTDQQQRSIKDSVTSISHIRNVSIDVRQ